jgi:hypothetical protein
MRSIGRVGEWDASTNACRLRARHLHIPTLTAHAVFPSP